jgi:hypothetical protein
MGPAVAETANIPVVVPSDRVAEISGKLGYSNVLVANNALPDSMFEMVKTVLR